MKDRKVNLPAPLCGLCGKKIDPRTGWWLDPSKDGAERLASVRCTACVPPPEEP